VLPILYGDRLMGKLDATADRDAGVLRVNAIHKDVALRQDDDGCTESRDQGSRELARTGPHAVMLIEPPSNRQDREYRGRTGPRTQRGK